MTEKEERKDIIIAASCMSKENAAAVPFIEGMVGLYLHAFFLQLAAVAFMAKQWELCIYVYIYIYITYIIRGFPLCFCFFQGI